MKINNTMSLYTIQWETISYMYSSIEDSETVLGFGRNHWGLKKLSSSVWRDKWLIWLPKCQMSYLSEETSGSSDFLNAAMFLLKRVFYREQYFTHSHLDYLIPGLTVTGSERVSCSSVIQFGNSDHDTETGVSWVEHAVSRFPCCGMCVQPRVRTRLMAAVTLPRIRNIFRSDKYEYLTPKKCRCASMQRVRHSWQF